MKCTKCGHETNERFFLAGIASVTRQMVDGQWVCFDCLPPKEQLRIKLKRQGEEQSNLLSEDEFNRLSIVASWTCPYKRNPHNCEGFLCSVEEWDKCVEALRAQMLIDKHMRELSEKRKYGGRILRVP